MALTEASRNVLYTRFLEFVDDEKAVSELLSYYPVRDIDEPTTRDLVITTGAELRAEIAEVRTELAGVRTELKGDIADVRTELAGVRTEFKGDIAELRSEFKGDIAALRSDMDDKFQSNLRWTIGTMIALISPLYAILLAQLITW